MAPFDLKEEILRLKEERNAIILAHSYQTGDIQDMADYVGDSLGLAYKAQNTDCDVIAFCGVHFNSPEQRILIIYTIYFSCPAHLHLIIICNPTFCISQIRLVIL